MSELTTQELRILKAWCDHPSNYYKAARVAGVEFPVFLMAIESPHVQSVRSTIAWACSKKFQEYLNAAVLEAVRVSISELYSGNDMTRRHATKLLLKTYRKYRNFCLSRR